MSIKSLVRRSLFPGSGAYWEKRYRKGGNSGGGSYGESADYKADFLNRFVADHGIGSVIEFGCGDGNQLSLARYPRYVGLDVSSTAVNACIRRFVDDPTKSFISFDSYNDPAAFLQADLALSLDVIYHLVEDAVFERYMTNLFRAATRNVVIYATDREVATTDPHVRHRGFTPWVERNTDWKLAETVEPPAGMKAFFVYER